ncbi:hypothetical protein CAPTEDRAFT_200678 [Capitella teleta]|uniref:LRRCT domain-containing protein n=1 Tax=Capitella teleta TaxID=283909 RepID=R7TLT3_CAPTE|nr:hypothetical protein CAPTEDRAFT_200678 [Capitella teleta]|eukprot:ELT92511.1 hypothetical protein CAPTEDRAFT_200678 [Capitella teleta]
MVLLTLFHIVSSFAITVGSYDASGRELNQVPTDIPLNESHIILNNNDIDSLPVGIFEDYKDLSYLDISKNRLTDILPNTFIGTRIDTLRLANNLLKAFPDISEIGHCLRSLMLSFNAITEIPIENVASLQQLAYLDLSGNKNLPPIRTFKSNLSNTLHSFRLEYCNMWSVTDELTDLKWMMNLWISNGRFSEQISDNTFSGTQVVNLYVQNMGLVSFPVFPEGSNRIKILNLSKNKFQEELNARDFGQLESIVQLTLQNCRIDKFPDVTSMNNTLKVLDVQMNNISTIPSNILDYMSELETLLISHNPLGRFPSLGIRATSLKSLSIGGTQIRISCKNLSEFLSLEKLDVSDNSLNNTDALALQCLHSPVKHLNLNSNYITVINLVALPFFRTLQEIELGGNPIQCISKGLPHDGQGRARYCNIVQFKAI